MDGKMVKWERGIDRIADLSLLATSSPTQATLKDRSLKYYQLNDIWQEFKIKFSVFDAFATKGDSVWFESQIHGKIEMTPTKSKKWIESKYGKDIMVWECTIKHSNDFENTEGEFTMDGGLGFEYQYLRERADTVI